jgi:hypothetical protein
MKSISVLNFKVLLRQAKANNTGSTVIWSTLYNYHVKSNVAMKIRVRNLKKSFGRRDIPLNVLLSLLMASSAEGI